MKVCSIGHVEVVYNDDNFNPCPLCQIRDDWEEQDHADKKKTESLRLLAKKVAEWSRDHWSIEGWKPEEIPQGVLDIRTLLEKLGEKP